MKIISILILAMIALLIVFLIYLLPLILKLCGLAAVAWLMYSIFTGGGPAIEAWITRQAARFIK
jgi:hypothetical protein